MVGGIVRTNDVGGGVILGLVHGVVAS